MKLFQTIKNSFLQFSTMLLLSFISVQTFAQDKKVDINLNVDKGNNNWYTQPWVWVLAAAVFILLLAAILRGGRRAS